MKNKFRYIVSLMMMLVLLSSAVTTAYGDHVVGYFPPRPKDISVLVSRPSISMQLVLNGSKVKEIDMKINGKKVNAKYDAKLQRVFYKPLAPLKKGIYKVDLTVSLEGFKSITQSFKFTVSENAVNQLPSMNEEQKKALNYSNRYRKLLGFSGLQADQSLNAAAMAHSNYMAMNKKLTHNEFMNDKGVVGEYPYNRADAFGYAGGYVLESIAMGHKDYEATIENLMSGPYDRIHFINPFITDMGYGVKDKYYTFNFGEKKSGQDKMIVYPIDHQIGVPTSWDGNETPSPLRLHKNAQIVGYPITISYFSKNEVEGFIATKVILKDSTGKVIEVYKNTPQNDQQLKDTIVIIPTRPLKKGEKYTVSVEGKILFKNKLTKLINKTWEFTTTSKENNEWMRKYIFSDLEGHWAKQYIVDLGEQKIVTEKENNMYKPNDEITRAEFTEFIVNALGIPTKSYEGIFKDVKKDTNKAVYIEAAFREGIVKGVGSGNFAPNKRIKREEIAILIMKAYEKKGDLSKIKKTSLLSFKDNRDISTWAIKDIRKVYELGIMKGREDKSFAPKDFATRAEAAVVVKKLLEQIKKE